MTFAWDDHKRQRNLAKHGLDFPAATQLFDGRSVLHAPVLYPTEERYATMGELNGRIVVVIWTWRHEAIRLISARAARMSERRLYRRAFPG